MNKPMNAKAMAYRIWLLNEPTPEYFFNNLVNDGFDPEKVFIEVAKIKLHLVKQMSRSLLEDGSSSDDDNP